MCNKSLIYTAQTNTTTVMDGDVIPLGTAQRRRGCCIKQDGNGIAICGDGYFAVDVSVVAESSSTDPISINLQKNGVDVIGATSAVTPAGGGVTVALGFSVIVANSCKNSNSLLSVVLNGADAEIENMAVSVEEL